MGIYVDQRHERKQVIAGVDHKMSVLLQKHNKRTQLLDDRMKVTLKKQNIQDDLVLAKKDLEISENDENETLQDQSPES